MNTVPVRDLTGRNGRVWTGLLPPGSPLWQNMLAAVRHDVYHLPEYCALWARREGGRPAAFFAESDAGERFLLPLIVRPVPTCLAGGPFFDATSPYGYPGPLVDSPAGGEAFLGAVLPELVRLLRENGIISLFCRLHPLLPVPAGPLATAGKLVNHGETVSIDLALPEEEAWGQYDPDHRRNIRRFDREGHRAFIDEEWRYFDEFCDLYNQTMYRCKADLFYHLSGDYLEVLRQSLSPWMRMCVVEIEGQTAAAGIITESCGIIQGYLNGTRQEFVRRSPTLLMYDYLRRWGKARGNRWFHLGSGVGGRQDSLFDFKARFSKVRHPFLTWRLVADEAACRALVAEWETAAGMPADAGGGFFPAYRKPAGQILPAGCGRLSP